VRDIFCVFGIYSVIFHWDMGMSMKELLFFIFVLILFGLAGRIDYEFQKEEQENEYNQEVLIEMFGVDK
jgi:hypothetical protein